MLICCRLSIHMPIFPKLPQGKVLSLISRVPYLACAQCDLIANERWLNWKTATPSSSHISAQKVGNQGKSPHGLASPRGCPGTSGHCGTHQGILNLLLPQLTTLRVARAGSSGSELSGRQVHMDGQQVSPPMVTEGPGKSHKQPRFL